VTPTVAAGLLVGDEHGPVPVPLHEDDRSLPDLPLARHTEVKPGEEA
jgi:hypothetical protein